MHASLGPLLVINLLLQLFDGFASYYILSAGVPEANPLVASAIENWGLSRGVFYSKLLGCILLLIVFMLRHRARKVATQGLKVLTYVYSCLGVLLLLKMLLLFT